jgi:outer membrane murein-binding lipoprotein Lpp
MNRSHLALVLSLALVPSTLLLAGCPEEKKADVVDSSTTMPSATASAAVTAVPTMSASVDAATLPDAGATDAAKSDAGKTDAGRPGTSTSTKK